MFFVEFEVPPYFDWLLGALLQFGIALLILLVFGTLFTFLAAAVRLGPSEAFYLVAKILVGSVPDFLQTSPRRVYALARLAVQESIRRRVLVVFIVFVVILLFAGWYLDTDSENPARLYINLVLTATNFLMLLLGFVLSAFSLPTDIQNRTMYTITTKPVRTGEIVLGRFLGFAFVGTVLMILMAGVSYVFVVRGLSHTHQAEKQWQPVESGGKTIGERGNTTRDKRHRHEITLNSEGVGRTDTRMGHWHPVTKAKDGTVVIGGPRGELQARVPLLGELSFIDRTGRPTNKGVNNGDISDYRSYIEGNSPHSAVWTFDHLTAEEFPDGLPLEMTISVFRTYKGDIEHGIRGTLQFINPDPLAKVASSEEFSFTAEEFTTFRKTLPREVKAFSQNTLLKGADGQPLKVDIFQDLVYNGKIQIKLKCSEPGQYFGVARHDLYIHAADHSFAVNFVKGYFDLWLQMLIAIAFGTAFSTFLSGPVALLAALSSMLVGFVSEFIFRVATGEEKGGGPIESVYRIVTQRNLTSSTELHPAVQWTIGHLDYGMMQAMRAIANLLPNYRWFDTVRYVAYGMNISGDAVAQHASLAAAYIVVVLIVGYFFLKTREIAA